jgi:hypothetical protein
VRLEGSQMADEDAKRAARAIPLKEISPSKGFVQATAKQNADERRVQDALEDDEVREELRRLARLKSQ